MRLINLKEGDKLVSAAVLEPEDEVMGHAQIVLRLCGEPAHEGVNDPDPRPGAPPAGDAGALVGRRLPGGRDPRPPPIKRLGAQSGRGSE